MVSNPKAAVQYGVIFASMLPQSPTASLTVALPIAVFLLEALWYIVVALALSAPATRTAYLRTKLAVDRIAGAVLAALGIKLLVSSR
jgi:threonine/homoserine/homoserine lactone efflux protein